ncbi:MAG TPA: hypothetical protein VHG53_00205 [Candidatus Limnocylindria bacterium]|nr:hypothetical protein [Candidatus Limnocylindria bacterium]
MRGCLTLGIWFGVGLMLLGLLSSCTIILLPLGVHFIWIGFLVLLAFVVARALVAPKPSK